MRRAALKSGREPTIALINIVFLMLIFFLVAGTLSRPLDTELRLVRTTELDGVTPPDALVIHADGRMTWRGQPAPSAAEFLDSLPEAERARVRVVPDRALPAAQLIELARKLRQAGAGQVVIVTERGLR